ncbi:MAG: hypothetical protein AAF387_14595, partial [Pseudomonadota bacterium]
GLGVVSQYEAFVEEGGDLTNVDPATFVWKMARAWLGRRLWQDGIGVVPDRDSEYERVRIDPMGLSRGRTLLCWALQRLAHTEADWVSLESFLTRLFVDTEDLGFNFFWGDSYAWDPKISLAKKKDKESDDRRRLAYWLDDEGTWAANALWVTLYTMGLIERGRFNSRDYFRLTNLGRAVFGAPEAVMAEVATERRFLVVQPNFEVTVYVREMQGQDLQRILPFLTKTETAGGEVQGFRLERERVYQALEEGLSLEEIHARLTEHAREAIPQVVERALREWSGKRESLILRRKVGVLIIDKTTC